MRAYLFEATSWFFWLSVLNMPDELARNLSPSALYTPDSAVCWNRKLNDVNIVWIVKNGKESQVRYHHSVEQDRMITYADQKVSISGQILQGGDRRFQSRNGKKRGVNARVAVDRHRHGEQPKSHQNEKRVAIDRLPVDPVITWACNPGKNIKIFY